jgi:hypothetical protein
MVFTNKSECFDTIVIRIVLLKIQSKSVCVALVETFEDNVMKCMKIC